MADDEFPFSDPIEVLTFTDHLIGKQVSITLAADIDCQPLPPADQRAQIKRPLELIMANAYFFAQRSQSGYTCYRQQSLSPLNFISAQYIPCVPVRMMFSFVETASHRLVTAPGHALFNSGAMRRWVECVNDRVKRGRVSRVQVSMHMRALLFVPARVSALFFDTYCSKHSMIFGCAIAAIASSLSLSFPVCRLLPPHACKPNQEGTSWMQ
jgi:hypothetical protein